MDGGPIGFTPIPSAQFGVTGWDPTSGMFDQSAAMELQKALVAGTDIAHPGAGTIASGDAFALRPENLDPTLYNLTFRMEHIRLWPQLYKQIVGNVINEHNVLTAHGSGVAFFHNEGDLPAEDDSDWDRRYSRVRCMGTTRRTTILAQALNMAHMKAEAHQVAGGTMWMLQQLEVMLFSGDSAMSNVQFDGLQKQITDGAPDANIIDMRGSPLTGEYVNFATGIVKGAPNYGLATDLYMPLEVFTDLADDVAPHARYQIPPQGYQQGIAGLPVKGWHSQNGVIRFQDDVFLSMGGVPNAAALGAAATRPGTPTQNAALAAAGTGSSFTAADAGDYRYRVVACNRFGKSIPVNMTGAITVAAGQSVTFSIDDGTPVEEYYEIYRSSRNGGFTSATFQMRVARTGATTIITDDNSWIPGTGIAFLVQQNREYFLWNRLLKFMKVPLARIDTSDRFMLLLFGNLLVHAPQKSAMFINVGQVTRSFAYTT